VTVGVDDDPGTPVGGVGRGPLHRRTALVRPSDDGVDVGHREVQGDGGISVARAEEPDFGVLVGQVERQTADLELGVADAVVVVHVGLADQMSAEDLAVPGDGRAGVADDEVGDQLRGHAADPAVCGAVTEGPGSRRRRRRAARR
jgi:hypothetical protein